MGLNGRNILTITASTPPAADGGSGTGNQEEGLLMYYDGNDEDSHDGDSDTTWYDITDHEYTPAVNPEENFNTVTYSGNSSTNAITGVGFQPDLVWIKRRNSSVSHYLNDSVTPGSYLRTDTDDLDTTSSTFTSFDSDGFTLASSTLANNSSGTYVAWCFKAGGEPTGVNPVAIDGTLYSSMTAAGLTDGTEAISRLSVNTKLGFSIVKWTAPALAVDTVAHGLGQPPEMIIMKNTSGTARNWNVYHKGVGTSKNLHLNTTDPASTSEYWTANSTTFSIQDQSASADRIAYCFASKRGVSKVGQYTGKGNPTRIYTGFEPAWIMIKNTSRSGNSNTDWQIFDNKRSDEGDVLIDRRLRANENSQEAELGYGAGTGYIRFERDGVTLQGNSFVDYNYSGDEYIYLAFAKNTKETELIPNKGDFTEGTVTTGAEIELDANDYSGSGNWLNTGDTSGYDGTISGATYTDDGSSDYFDFDGSNDYVSLSGNLNSSTKAFEIWLSPDSFSSDSWAFQQGDGQGVENYLRVYSSGLQVRMGNQTVTHTYSTTNKWIHVVGTHKASNGFEFYLDGEKVKESSSSLQALSNNYFHIGVRRNNSLSGYFNGKIGIVRVYDFALTGTQVKANYDATYGLYQYADLELHLDAGDTNSYSGSGSTWSDLTTGNHDVTLTSMNANQHDEEIGGWFEFDGSSDYGTIPHSTDLNISTSFTVEAWVNRDDNGEGYIAVKQGGSGAYGYYLQFHNNTAQGYSLAAYNTSNSRYTAHATIAKSGTAGQWQHVVGTCDGSNVKIYVNGDLKGTTAFSGTPAANTVETVIGAYASPYSGKFDGKIGQVRIYQTALTESQIRQNYNFTKNDYPNGFHATLNSSNPPTFSTDSFDFTRGSIASGNDQINISSDGHKALQDSVEGSIVAWVYPESVTGRHTIFGAGHTSANNRWVLLRTTTSNGLQFSINNAGSSQGFYVSGNALTLNSWNHVAITVDSAGTAKAKINRVEKTVTYDSTYSRWFNDVATDSLTIGSFDRGGSGEFYDGFDGKIGQIKVYNRPLTMDEIDALYDAGR